MVHIYPWEPQLYLCSQTCSSVDVEGSLILFKLYVCHDGNPWGVSDYQFDPGE